MQQLLSCGGSSLRHAGARCRLLHPQSWSVPTTPWLWQQLVSGLFPATISVAVCHESKVGLLLKQAENAPVLKIIITMGTEVDAADRELANKTGIAVYTFKEIEVR